MGSQTVKYDLADEQQQLFSVLWKLLVMIFTCYNMALRQVTQHDCTIYLQLEKLRFQGLEVS